jgi:hypothetical protein
LKQQHNPPARTGLVTYSKKGKPQWWTHPVEKEQLIFVRPWLLLGHCAALVRLRADPFAQLWLTTLRCWTDASSKSVRPIQISPSRRR